MNTDKDGSSQGLIREINVIRVGLFDLDWSES